MDLSSCYKIGRIVKPHGVKGEVTVFIEPEAPADLPRIDTWFVEKKNRLVPVFPRSFSLKGTRAYVAFEDIVTMEAAEAYRQCDVYLPKTSRARPAKGDFYDDEVAGFEVNDMDGKTLGTVKGVMRSGQNRLLVLEGPREILIPVNAPFIKRITRTARTIQVDLPDGFLDI